jgi:arylsulfatase A-like enzyme
MTGMRRHHQANGVADIDTVAVGGLMAPPNVVLILADDMGFSDVGCYGGEIQTPNAPAPRSCPRQVQANP